jgi:hypothetical protein
MDLSIRYYSPAFNKRVAAEIPAVLEQIRQTHGLTSEIIAVRQVPSLIDPTIIGADEAHEKEIYARDFMANYRVLNARTGALLSRTLRSRSGRYCVAGTIALVSSEGVEWYAARQDQFAALDEDPGLDFLKALLAEGPALIGRLWYKMAA